MDSVLIIDDDPYILKSISNYFEDELNFDKNKNIDQFEDKLRHLSNYKAIILDIMIESPEEMDLSGVKETGEYLYKEIKKKDPNKNIIVISAKSENDVEIDFHDSHTWYFSKPLKGGEDFEDMYKIITGQNA